MHVSSLMAPVLVMVAVNDTVQADHVSIAQEVERSLFDYEKKVELIIYPSFGSDGHALFFEVRDIYWRDVLDFLEDNLQTS